MSGVPKKIFEPVMLEVLRLENFETKYEAWTWLAQRINVHEDTIYRIFGKGDRGAGLIDFDFADLILTRCNAAHLWYQPPLSDIYWDLPLECLGCEKYLTVKRNRKSNPRFCGNRCEKAYASHAS